MDNIQSQIGYEMNKYPYRSSQCTFPYLGRLVFTIPFKGVECPFHRISPEPRVELGMQGLESVR